MMAFFIFSFGAVTVLTLVAYAFKKASTVMIVSGILLAASIFLISSMFLALQMLGILVCSIIYSLICTANDRKAKPHVMIIYTLLVAVICSGSGYYEYRTKWNLVYQLRDEFPVLSLASRLDYEKDADQNNGSKTSEIELKSSLEDRLLTHEKEAEDKISSSWRIDELSEIHDEARQEFIEAQIFGFGVRRTGRMVVSKKYIELPEQQPEPIPMLPKEYPADDFRYDPVTGEFPLFKTPETEQMQIPSPSLLTKVHFEGTSNFLNPERNGYVEDREHVVGFRGHQFLTSSTNNSPFSYLIREQTTRGENVESKTGIWKIYQLQLVSLLKHEQPVVYSTPTLPKLEDLKNVKTRSLDSFEKTGLQQLHHEEDVVIKSGINHIQMLGSLRASKDCLTCHSVKRGALLGAFSYRLFRVQPLRKQTESIDKRK